ncbi:MAG: hypothetical protein ACREU2_10000 [Steroidobacteraceae bacterium]
MPSKNRLYGLAALLALPMTALAAPPDSAASRAGGAFLDRFDLVKLVGSTVPGNGDINPYGIFVAPNSVGRMREGGILVSNFNNASNAQGTGTTIVELMPNGTLSLFAFIDPSSLPGACPGGVGLTTALVALQRGWVIVGSLPTRDGTSATAQAGCLIVLNSEGQAVETFAGNGISGPWDMTVKDGGDQAALFVTNVLNGDVTTGAPHVVNQGTVLRISLSVPRQGQGLPQVTASEVIGSGFPETADPSALVIGPTGVGLGPDGTLYVADSVDNRIAAIPKALTRSASAGTGNDVSVGGAINDPLGLTIAPNGNVITANGGDGNLVETRPTGKQVAVKTVETVTGAGSLFGIVLVPDHRGVYFVDDGDNTVKVLTRANDEREDD